MAPSKRSCWLKAQLSSGGGGRFAVAGVRDVETGVTHDPVAFVFNVFDELRRIAPPAER